jgi:hypothetical protein
MDKTSYEVKIVCDPRPLLTAMALLIQAPKEIIHRAAGLLASDEAICIESNFHVARGAGELVVTLKPANRLSELVSNLRSDY